MNFLCFQLCFQVEITAWLNLYSRGLYFGHDLRKAA
jgi:hypothetical protein